VLDQKSQPPRANDGRVVTSMRSDNRDQLNPDLSSLAWGRGRAGSDRFRYIAVGASARSGTGLDRVAELSAEIYDA